MVFIILLFMDKQAIELQVVVVVVVVKSCSHCLGGVLHSCVLVYRVGSPDHGLSFTRLLLEMIYLNCLVVMGILFYASFGML